MSLRKILASAFLICGLSLVVGAVVVGLGWMPANALDGAKPQVTQKVKTAKPIDTMKVEAAWRDWMDQNGVTQSSFAIGRADTILHSAAQKRSPDTAYAMASLSKAITGMCLNQLLMVSQYSWSSSLADLAPEFAKLNFTPAEQMLDLTLTQIATHTSGIPKTLNYGKMSTRSPKSQQPTDNGKGCVERAFKLWPAR